MLPSTVVMFEQSPSIRISQGLLMLNLLEASSELSHQIKKKIIPGVLLNVLEVEIYQPFPPAGVVYDVTVFSFRQKRSHVLLQVHTEKMTPNIPNIPGLFFHNS